MKESTRFKLAIGILGLYFVEGITKALLPGFPIEVIVGAEGAIVLYYFSAKTLDNIKAAKYNCPPVVNGQ